MLFLSVATLAVSLQAAQLDPKVNAAWDALKSLEGEWYGQATDGRKIRYSVHVIAGESVVMSRSWFEAHPGEMMVNMYHLDQGKLMLTHYCVAKNQPRMRATEISPDGKKILFVYFDGTNLRDRDQGHMDKASYEFPDSDTIKSRWTWYSGGKEQWMEEFTMKRGEPVSHESSTSVPVLKAASCCG